MEESKTFSPQSLPIFKELKKFPETLFSHSQFLTLSQRVCACLFARYVLYIQIHDAFIRFIVCASSSRKKHVISILLGNKSKTKENIHQNYISNILDSQSICIFACVSQVYIVVFNIRENWKLYVYIHYHIELSIQSELNWTELFHSNAT